MILSRHISDIIAVMSNNNTPATKSDIEDVLEVLQKFMQQVDDRFNRVESKLVEHDKRFDDLYGAVAELSAQVRDYHNEMVFLNHHVDKLTAAIKQIAKETGVKLAVEL